MTRLVAPLLIALLAAAGVTPCMAMDMDMATKPSSHCDEMPSAADPMPNPAPGPLEGCCDIGDVPDTRTPVDRPAVVAGESPLTPVGLALIPLPRQVSSRWVLDAGPPPTPLRRHLLLSVLLI
jgi:hypothetical protein